jgi:hypothetical protein
MILHNLIGWEPQPCSEQTNSASSNGYKLWLPHIAHFIFHAESKGKFMSEKSGVSVESYNLLSYILHTYCIYEVLLQTLP